MTCSSGKVGYESAAEAHRTRGHLSKRTRSASVFVYKCPECFAFHLTSQPQHRKGRPARPNRLY